ncbi:unnamed protein product [Rangifer tarandus platyrhynchus]|uniref:Uncharacterized protein n=2 Tax=Rangifer tarandus platyrhynchus TaxID=3082113 RepID=A0AC60A0U0_RANTA|nr:unnamed protein product [Rangifer tarandus platyrhynchus]
MLIVPQPQGLFMAPAKWQSQKLSMFDEPQTPHLPPETRVETNGGKGPILILFLSGVPGRFGGLPAPFLSMGLRLPSHLDMPSPGLRVLLPTVNTRLILAYHLHGHLLTWNSLGLLSLHIMGA